MKEYEGVELNGCPACHLGVAVPDIEVVHHRLEAGRITHGWRQGGQVQGGSQHSVHQDISIPAGTTDGRSECGLQRTTPLDQQAEQLLVQAHTAVIVHMVAVSMAQS